jgi:hypothetical protein
MLLLMLNPFPQISQQKALTLSCTDAMCSFSDAHDVRNLLQCGHTFCGEKKTSEAHS